MSTDAKFKVVLTFQLKPGAADEELRRSRQDLSFPRMLAKQPGCELIELVKVSENQTMSIQTWTTQPQWWAALEAVKRLREGGESEGEPTDEILESRDYVGGTIEALIDPLQSTLGAKKVNKL